MKTPQAGGTDPVEEYIATFPESTAKLLRALRKTIEKAAPQAESRISYRMPAWFQNGALAYIAGYARHIGFYPTGSGIAAFKAELEGYKTSKGAVQFPLDKPIPHELVARIVRFKLEENGNKQKR